MLQRLLSLHTRGSKQLRAACAIAVISSALAACGGEERQDPSAPDTGNAEFSGYDDPNIHPSVTHAQVFLSQHPGASEHDFEVAMIQLARESSGKDEAGDDLFRNVGMAFCELARADGYDSALEYMSTKSYDAEMLASIGALGVTVYCSDVTEGD